MIKELREKRGMTQVELAKKAKISQGYIEKLEPSTRPGQPKAVRRSNRQGPSAPSVAKQGRPWPLLWRIRNWLTRGR